MHPMTTSQLNVCGFHPPKLSQGGRICQSVVRIPTVSPVKAATATAVSSTSASDDATEQHADSSAAQQTQEHLPHAGAAPARRRRRSTTSTVASTESSSAPRRYQAVPDYAQLFQQQPAARTRIRRVAKGQAAVLPQGALSDPKALKPTNDGSQQSVLDQQEQLDSELLAQFERFAASFKRVAGQQQQQHSSQAVRQQQQQQPHSAAAGHSQLLQQQPRAAAEGQQNQQQQQSSSSRLRQSTRDLIELFGTSDAAGPPGFAPGPQVTRLPKGAPPAAVPQPSGNAAQKLANLFVEQRQQQLLALKHQRRQQQQQDAASEAGSSDTQDPNTAPGAGVRLMGSARPRADGLTRIYMPAPPKAAALSPAERQPLRLLSIRQQQQMREEARKAAVKRLREKAVKDYEATVQQLLNWQGTAQRTYLAAPAHLPVAVQQSWTQSPSSTSSSSTPAAAAATSADADSAAAAARQLSAEEQQVVCQVDAAVQQQLGVTLPERAYRGERGLILSGLAPQAVRERLGRWVGCCGRDYVIQLMTKEPSLLGQEPQVLLQTLEGFSQEMDMQPQDCVSYASKHVAVIGLDRQQLHDRLSALADALGVDGSQARRLAASQPALLMLHPSHLKERMTALGKLLPEAASKLPRLVVGHPFLITKSARALARSILQLSDALDLSSWAACRLVTGQPSILSTNFDVLHNKLDRLQQLTAASHKWRRELQALSPAALARCLVCTDAALDRLQQLAGIGAAGSGRLPPINLILTQPAAHFESTLQAVAAAKQRAADRAAEGDIDSATHEEWQQDRRPAAGAGAEREGAPRSAASQSSGASQTSSASASTAAKAAAAAALARLRSKSSISISSSSAVGVSSGAAGDGSESDDEGRVLDSESQGLLGADADWRGSLANALLSSAEDAKALLLGRNKQQPAADEAGAAEERPLTASGAGGRRRR